MADVGVGLRGFVGHGVRGIGVVGACAVGRGEVAGCGDAGGRDEVGGRRGGVAGRVGDVLQADRDVVAVDEREVHEVLGGRDAASKVEFCQGGWGVALNEESVQVYVAKEMLSLTYSC